MAHPVLAIDPADTELDLLAVGEVLLRLSPPRGAGFDEAEQLELHVGGAEYNVAYALAGLGRRSCWAGALPEGHPLSGRVRGHAAEVGLGLHPFGGSEYDGYGRRDRIGWNLVETGTGERAAYSWYDRGHTGSVALADWAPGDWSPGARARVPIVHTGGTFAGLGEGPRALIRDLIAWHAEAGGFVSYDLNWRSRMWEHAEAVAFTRSVLPQVRLLTAGPRDLAALAEEPGLDPIEACARLGAAHPALWGVAIPERKEHRADRQDWTARLWTAGDDRLHEGPVYEDLAIEERIGGGDAFLAGLLFGILEGAPPDEALALGVHMSALGMATRGDTARVHADALRSRRTSGPPEHS